jgi:hypothetical protein
LVAFKTSGAYAWLENPGEILPSAWISHTLASGPPVSGAYGLRLVDWDGDDDLDVLGSARQVDHVFWLEQPADPAQPWALHTLFQGPPLDDPTDLAWGDLDRDGDADVAVACQEDCAAIVWLENQDQDYLPHTVGSLRKPQGVAIADLDQDGFMEIIAAEYLLPVSAGGDDIPGDDGQIVIYEPRGNLTAPWTGQAILNNLVSGDELFLYDIDQDDQLDILSTSNDRGFTPAGGRTFWLELSAAATVHLPLIARLPP